MTKAYELNPSAYTSAAKAVVDFVKGKLGQPKYQLEARDLTGRDYSMTPTKAGVNDRWSLSDRFGDFFKSPNGETEATYISKFGLRAKTYEDDIFEIVDNVICDELFDKYDMSVDEYYDDADAQDFISTERNRLMMQLEDDEASSISDFIAKNSEVQA